MKLRRYAVIAGIGVREFWTYEGACAFAYKFGTTARIYKWRNKGWEFVV